MSRYGLALLFAVLASASRPSHALQNGAAKPTDASKAADAEASLVIEVGAGPIAGLDNPLRGASAGILLGAAIGAVEASARPSLAYDASLGSLSVRVDLVIGIGDGFRLIAGGMVPLKSAILEPEGAALPLEVGNWPCRFGLESKLIESAFGPFGSRVSASASITYSAYRVAKEASESAKAALAGTAAFAACVELLVSVGLSWRVGLSRGTRGEAP